MNEREKNTVYSFGIVGYGRKGEEMLVEQGVKKECVRTSGSECHLLRMWAEILEDCFGCSKGALVRSVFVVNIQLKRILFFV
jgi:hypothetical protein